MECALPSRCNNRPQLCRNCAGARSSRPWSPRGLFLSLLGKSLVRPPCPLSLSGTTPDATGEPLNATTAT
jgi:hypothetical protein